MRATRFNRSEIMSQAWMMFRTSIFGYKTFGQALQAAWRYAKENVARQEAVEARKAQQMAMASQPKPETKRDRFYKKFNREISAAYRNVRFGRNDWAVDYRRY